MRFVPKAITRTIGRQILVTKKNSPHIAFGVGVAGVIGSTVLACRATLKLNETLDGIKADVDAVKDENDRASLQDSNVLATPTPLQQDMAIVYGKGVVAIGRLYGPAILVGAASIGALAGSHVTLTRRNAALTAAFTAVTAAYEEYRGRVREELGDERERDLYLGTSTEVIKIDGTKTVVKFADPNRHSEYARFFDETSKHWCKDAEVNRLWVQAQQNYLNNLLQTRGHVFLNEAYDSLGIERSSAGAIVGWVIGPEGDNFIDFGMFEATERNRAFINGLERSILLDFNVDGVVYDKI